MVCMNYRTGVHLNRSITEQIYLSLLPHPTCFTPALTAQAFHRLQKTRML